jgi:hypothetical protein
MTYWAGLSGSMQRVHLLSISRCVTPPTGERPTMKRTSWGVFLPQSAQGRRSGLIRIDSMRAIIGVGQRLSRAREECGHGVVGMAVVVVPGPVVTGRDPRIRVPGGDLHVTQRHASIQARRDVGVPE